MKMFCSIFFLVKKHGILSPSKRNEQVLEVLPYSIEMAQAIQVLVFCRTKEQYEFSTSEPTFNNLGTCVGGRSNIKKRVLFKYLYLVYQFHTFNCFFR